MNIFSSLFGHHHSHPHAYRSILFVLRRPQVGCAHYTPYHQPSSGLINSATFVSQMLSHHGVISNLVQVIDSNDIDREVARFNPDVVVLEAIWCPPSKLVELTALARHRHRHWIVRNHSELPFLSMEGTALDWVLTYGGIKHVSVACNSPVAASEIELLSGREVVLLPNYYPVDQAARCAPPHGHKPHVLNVGCFGAIRPLKNHLEQAAAAILFARERGQHLHFHINASRIEGRGESILKSLRSLFAHTPDAKLIEHGWLSHHAFVALCRTMDIGLQVSFSETFNIVAADLVNVGVPVVGSTQIPWLPEAYAADPTDAFDIVDRMAYALDHGAHREREALEAYSQASAKTWLRYLRRD